uniref:protein-disulfide reductase DsbD family protein n=1 Tax=Yoonia sp. TaxID=2212373 RepID=UPI0040477B9A
MSLRTILYALLAIGLWTTQGMAAATQAYKSSSVEARLITAENGVAPGASALSAGLSLKLSEGWKTYWRSPGEVGLPPQIDWSGSTNLASAKILWPAPTRFRAFGIENFGYAKQVTFPFQITLADPGKPAILKADVFLLICSDVCVPQDFSLTLDLPAATGVDQSSADEIAAWSAKVPLDSAATLLNASASLSEDGSALIVAFDGGTNWSKADIFPETSDGTAFGAPDIRKAADNSLLWASFPIFGDLQGDPTLSLTLTTQDQAVTFETVPLSDTAIAPPFDVAKASASAAKRLQMLLIAFLGGLILNLMPCVLPVLSIKFSAALKMSNRPLNEVRLGFLASAAGTLAFMLLLALGVLALQLLGVSIGWGMQFQSAGFLIALVLVLGLFSANLFGLFEFGLPQGLMTRLARDQGNGYAGDFATGLFGAVMATPCSAPLLGTALAFALTGQPLDVVLIFTAMGIGLAMPYLAVAARPSWVQRLPKPGRWMIVLKAVLGLLLLGTLVWLLWVLQAVASPAVMIGVIIALIAILACVLWNTRASSLLPIAVATVIAGGSFALPGIVGETAPQEVASLDLVPFERAEIPRHVSLGHTVFVDVTADWCLTCKANKALVLDRDPVASLLAAPDVIPMQADWTRPDPAIQQFLEANGRFGIPFNIVYGPSAPEGIALSEVLTNDSVTSALTRAQTTR